MSGSIYQIEFGSGEWGFDRRFFFLLANFEPKSKIA